MLVPHFNSVKYSSIWNSMDYSKYFTFRLWMFSFSNTCNLHVIVQQPIPMQVPKQWQRRKCKWKCKKKPYAWIRILNRFQRKFIHLIDSDRCAELHSAQILVSSSQQSAFRYMHGHTFQLVAVVGCAHLKSQSPIPNHIKTKCQIIHMTAILKCLLRLLPFAEHLIPFWTTTPHFVPAISIMHRFVKLQDRYEIPLLLKCNFLIIICAAMQFGCIQRLDFTGLRFIPLPRWLDGSCTRGMYSDILLNCYFIE